MSQHEHRILSEIAAHLRGLMLSSNGLPQITADQFETLALELFAAQFEANAVYRELCTARGATPGAVAAWGAIPAVPAAGFKEFEVTCLAVAERTTEFHSSGTTGPKPSRHFHSRESLSLYQASLWAWFRKHLLPNYTAHNTELVVLTPPPGEAPHSSLVHMLETVRKELGAPASAFLGKVEAGGWAHEIPSVLDRLSGFGRAGQTQPRPVLLLGTAISFLELTEFVAVKKASLRLPPGSRIMETGGYKGHSRTVSPAQLQASICRHLGVPAQLIVSEYGMSELSSQAYAVSTGPLRVEPPSALKTTSPKAAQSVDVPRAKSGQRLFRFPPWARAVIVSPETGNEVAEGETGLIRVFDLANVFSVMAIQTEDLGVRHKGGFELLGRARNAEPRGCSLNVLERR